MEPKRTGTFRIRVCKNGYFVYADGTEGGSFLSSTNVIEDVWVFESWETLVHFLSSTMLQPEVNLLEEMVKANRKTKLEEETTCSFVSHVMKLLGRKKSQ